LLSDIHTTGLESLKGNESGNMLLGGSEVQSTNMYQLNFNGLTHPQSTTQVQRHLLQDVTQHLAEPLHFVRLTTIQITGEWRRFSPKYDAGQGAKLLFTRPGRQSFHEAYGCHIFSNHNI